MKQEEFNNYANSFQAIARLRLESIENLLCHLGNPQNKLKFVHIAGTNGKGSVSAFLQCIFSSYGLKTGKYISPNLIDVCERITVDGEQISQAELSRLLSEVKKAAHLTETELGEPPTQFEIWTAAAFLYFLQKDCDIIVLETGLGGTRDATNIIPAPLACVITHIAMDHMQYLGDTIEKIAKEKAGIIKTPSSGLGCTVTARQSPEALAVLQKVCKERKNTLICTAAAKSVSRSRLGEYFDYKDLKGLHCSMLGLHQLDNAAAAIETAKYLKIPEEHIRRGIEQARNTARFEIVSENPLTIFDGAHNADGMRSFVNGLKRYFPTETKSLIMASMGDKDVSASIAELQNIPHLEKIYTVAVKDNPRSMTAADLCGKIVSAGILSEPCADIAEAVSKCGTDMTAICGSLYLYKDFCETKKQP